MADKSQTNPTTDSPQQAAPKKQGWSENTRTIVFAVAVAVIFRSFCFEPFHIPSGSMKDTLMIGDFVFVSKYSYGYSRYSFPLGLPFFKGRVGGLGKPERGDVVVFRLPTNPHIDYIKRLIGLPGDRIQVKDSHLYINREPVRLERVEDYIETEEGEAGTQRIHPIPKFKETLPNGVEHYVLNDMEDGEVDNTQEYVVPEGHYFFMGDNRDHSIDSRYLDRVGFVPEENLVGRAEVVVLSVQEGESLLQFWRWPQTLRPGRFWVGLTNHLKTAPPIP